MADFFQNGEVATLHRLGDRPVEEIEADLVRFSRERPVALVLPCLLSELDGPALPAIVDEIARVPYIREVVVGLDLADRGGIDEARRFFGRLPQDVRILWNDGQVMQDLYRLFTEQGLAIGEPGKGRNAWTCFGYVLAAGRSQVIALQDCDVIGFRRDMLARLAYPVADPAIDYLFAKGYYARVGDRLYGRVTRLLVTPLLRSLVRTSGPDDLLAFLDSFRYPLAGEFCMMADLARKVRIPGDWGLEVGILAELFRNLSAKHVCQVDLADRYEHKHRALSPNNPEAGLSRMAGDIAISLFRNLAGRGVVLSREGFRTLKSVYVRTAQDFIERYHYDAVLNGIAYNRHEEEQAVEAFAMAIVRASERFLDDPIGKPLIPNWNRVLAAVPDAFDRLRDVAVEAGA